MLKKPGSDRVNSRDCRNLNPISTDAQSAAVVPRTNNSGGIPKILLVSTVWEPSEQGVRHPRRGGRPARIGRIEPTPTGCLPGVREKSRAVDVRAFGLGKAAVQAYRGAPTRTTIHRSG